MFRTFTSYNLKASIMAINRKKLQAGTIPKNVSITFRCSQLIKDAVQEQAGKEGLSASAFVENAVKEHLRRKGVRIEITNTIV